VQYAEPEPLPKTLEELMARRTPRKARGNTPVSNVDTRELAALREQLRRVTAERDALLKRAPWSRSRQLADEVRKEVLRLLRKGDQSDRAIARAVGVSPQTVGDLRRSIS
jgi:hypothetical protein